MLVLNCPYCGADKDETELTAGGEAHITRSGPGSSDEDFEEYPRTWKEDLKKLEK